jgi:cytoplasmic iron level regulating protein YaaA (DUF328/UPF0246 family)
LVLILLPPSEKKKETTSPTPAISVYSGVLYQALDWPSLSASAKKRASSTVVIISAKYGAITPDTRIETYKEKINNKVMAAPVAKVLDVIKTDLIIDCRSSTYKSVWGAPTDITVEIKVSTVVNGVRTVVTHMSKKSRGEVTRYLLQSTVVPQTPQQLHAIVSQAFTCNLIEATSKEPWVLEVYC